MRITKGIRHYWLLSICSLFLAALLVACGSATNATSGSSSSSSSNNSSGSSNQDSSSGSTSSSTSSTTVASSGTANGCPSNAVVTTASGNASIIVKPTQMNQTISAHNGDIIEIQLPFGHKWTGPTTSQGILQLQGPAGYASKSDNACVWRFVAKGTGTAQLIFHSQALCQAGQVCPMYITAMPFDFSVK
jgi:hypothetical protein